MSLHNPKPRLSCYLMLLASTSIIFRYASLKHYIPSLLYSTNALNFTHDKMCVVNILWDIMTSVTFILNSSFSSLYNFKYGFHGQHYADGFIENNRSCLIFCVSPYDAFEYYAQKCLTFLLFFTS